MASEDGGTKETTKSSIVSKRGTGIRCEGLRLGSEDMAWWRDAKFGMFIHWGLP